MEAVPVLAAVLAVCLWPARRGLSAGSGQRLDTGSLQRVDTGRGDGRPRQPATRRVAGRARNGRSRRGESRRLPYPAVRPLDVAATMDLLALLTGSGRALPEALGRVASVSSDAVRADLATVLAAHAWGLPLREAWALAGPVWQSAATALMLASTAGVPPSRILTRAAADLRAASGDRLDEAVARLGVRLVLPLGLAFLPAFVLLTVVPLVVSLAGSLLG